MKLESVFWVISDSYDILICSEESKLIGKRAYRLEDRNSAGQIDEVCVGYYAESQTFYKMSNGILLNKQSVLIGK